jgi:hypothetical protein
MTQVYLPEMKALGTTILRNEELVETATGLGLLAKHLAAPATHPMRLGDTLAPVATTFSTHRPALATWGLYVHSELRTRRLPNRYSWWQWHWDQLRGKRRVIPYPKFSHEFFQVMRENLLYLDFDHYVKFWETEDEPMMWQEVPWPATS